MHATIDVRLTVSIDDDKTIPLATLAEFITEQNIESVLLEGLVEALCGEKHVHGNGEQRFQRRGTDTRTAVTTAGVHDFSLHYVEDTAADHDESSYFRPVEDVLNPWLQKFRGLSKPGLEQSVRTYGFVRILNLAGVPLNGLIDCFANVFR